MRKRQRHHRKDKREYQAKNLSCGNPDAESGGREEVLRGPENHVADPGVPMNAHRISCRGESRGNSSLFPELPEFHIVHHFHCKPPMRSYLFVRVPPDQLERTHTCVNVRARVAHLPGTNAHQESKREKAHGDFFARIEHLGVSEQGQMLPAFIAGQSQGTSQQVRPEMYAPARETQPPPRRFFIRLLQSVRLAKPARGKHGDMYYVQSRIVLCG